MAINLKSKRVLITGAGQGIGRASAIMFMKAGASVWATDVDRSKLDLLLTEIPRLNARVLDVRDANGIQRLVDELGIMDVLFNCAGLVSQGNILDCTERDWELSFSLNVASMYRMCRAFLPGMLTAGKGSIINMASVVSSVKGTPNRCAYGSSKAAVIGLTKAIAADFVTRGIRCNALCPGTIDTPSLGERMAQDGDVVSSRASFVARQPMGRLGKPDEVAAAALYLASDDSSFVTGQTFIIDGGWSI